MTDGSSNDGSGVRLQSLEVTRFRNLTNVRVDADGMSCWMFGPNGSGKSSLLEALGWLSTGKVGRRLPTASILQNHEGLVSVSARLLEQDRATRLTSRFERSGVERRVSKGAPGEVVTSEVEVTSQRTLARHLPVLEFSAATVDQLSGAPDGRRRWIDFGAFHRSDEFIDLWSRWRLLLRERNASLRLRYHDEYLDAIDPMLAEVGEQIDQLRRAFLDVVSGEMRLGLSGWRREILLQWHSGWAKDRSLTEALFQSRNEDQRRGITTRGIHRADLRIHVDGREFRELSRGQQRRVALEWFLAMHRATGERSVLALDDPFSELDGDGQRELWDALAKTSSQYWVTSIERPLDIDAAGCSSSNTRMFHVEQGSVVPRETI